MFSFLLVKPNQFFRNLANIYFGRILTSQRIKNTPTWLVFAASCLTCVSHLQNTTNEGSLACVCVSPCRQFLSKNSSRWSCFTSPPAEKHCGRLNSISEVMQRTEFLGCFAADCRRAASYTLCWAQGEKKKGRLRGPGGVCACVTSQGCWEGFTSSAHVSGCKIVNIVNWSLTLICLKCLTCSSKDYRHAKSRIRERGSEHQQWHNGWAKSSAVISAWL